MLGPVLVPTGAQFGLGCWPCLCPQVPRMEHFVLRNGARAELQLLSFKLIKHNGGVFYFNR